MNKLLRKSVLLLGVSFLWAMCAFMVPSLASAASWVGSGHLHSSNFGFTAPAVNTGESCRDITIHTFRHNPIVLTITGITFGPCHGAGSGNGCTVTAAATNLPWTVTAVSTTNIQIHGVHLDFRFETTPPGLVNPCSLHGLDITIRGTLGLGIGTQTVYDASQKTITFTNTTGLTTTASGSSFATVANGPLVATGSLNILD
ncbi:MAG: hypothetical protein ABUM26_01625 [Solirubrobacterales bacterium]